MKRVLSATAVLVVAVIGVASSATAAPSKAVAKGKTSTLRLVMKEVGFNYIDNPPRQGFDSPPLMGDQFAITSDLRTRSGAHAGIFEATCMVTRGGPRPTSVCYGFYSLKGGQIAGMARVGDDRETHVAIVGGTGAYEGVKGSSVEVSRGGDSPFADVTIHLIYP